MEKRFNITGLCVPEKHYMVDTSAKMELIGKMIERGDYFTINRARQFGKTTLLNGIRQKFSDRYLVIDMSFEGIGGTPFESQSGFVSTFCALVVKYLEFLKIDGKYLSFWKDSEMQTINDLSSTISEFCKNYPLPVILMIAWGLVGLLAGILSGKMDNIAFRTVYGFLSGFIFGWITNIMMFYYLAEFNLASVVGVYAASVPIDFIHGICTAVCLLLFYGWFKKTLKTVKEMQLRVLFSVCLLLSVFWYFFFLL